MCTYQGTTQQRHTALFNVNYAGYISFSAFLLTLTYDRIQTYLYQITVHLSNELKHGLVTRTRIYYGQYMSLTSFTYALLAGLLPSLVWLFFWLREDREHPEPRKMLAISFFGGMLAVIAAIFIERFIQMTVTDETTRYALWAATEEFLKLAVVALIALRSRYDDEPIDAMIYCITVALGFAALENALFIMGPLSGGAIAQSIVTGNMRFIGATLVHVVSSATIGFCIGYVFYKGHLLKFLAGIVGLSAAIALHAAFNLSIINAGAAETLKAFGWVWGAVVLLIVLFEEIKAVRPETLCE